MVNSRVLYVTLILLGLGAIVGGFLVLLVFLALIPISMPLRSTRVDWLLWALRMGATVGAIVG